MPDVVVCLVYHTQWLQFNAFEKRTLYLRQPFCRGATLPTLWITSSRIQVICQNDMRPSQESKGSMENPGGLGDVLASHKERHDAGAEGSGAERDRGIGSRGSLPLIKVLGPMIVRPLWPWLGLWTDLSCNRKYCVQIILIMLHSSL